MRASFTRTHVRARRAIHRLMLGKLEPTAEARLRRHLADCAGCRAHYEEHRRIEDALFVPSALNPAATERLLRAVLPRAQAPDHRSPMGRWTHRLAIGALMGALLAVVAVVGRFDEDATEHFTARGAAGRVPPAALALYRIDPRARAATRLRRAEGPLVLPRYTVIQLAYTAREALHVAVVGVDALGEIAWYHPRGGGSLRLRATRGEEPFEGAWTLVARPGPLDVLGIFSPRPLTVAEVEAIARRRGVLTAEEERRGVVVDRIEIEVRP